MKLIINGQTKNYFDTELNDILSNIDNISLFNYEHNLLSPKRMYEDALERVIEDFEELLDYTNFKESVSNSEHWKKVNKRYKSLIGSLVSYIDVTYAIMKCFYEKKRGKDTIVFNDKWLECVNKALIKKYKKNIKPFKKIFFDINNKIKHENREISQVMCGPCCCKNVTIVSNGFFIVGCNNDGSICPDSYIHKKWRGKDVGISYNKNIRDIIVCLYAISHYASETIKEILKVECGVNIFINKYESRYSDRLKVLIEKINNMDNFYFPNELEGDIKEFIFKDDILTIKFPCTSNYLKKVSWANKFNISFTARIDKSKKMNLLYFDGK